MSSSTRTARLAPLAAGAAALLVLAGCSGGSDEPGDLPTGALDALFEEMYGNYDEEASNRQMLEVEEIIAECMAEQGFDYTPVDYSSQTFYSDDQLDVEWGTLEFAKKYGYGNTTNPWGDVAQPEEDGQEWVDPNQEYVESMSETEVAAYYLALYGEQSVATGEEGEMVEWDWTTAGCSGKAQHEVYEDTGMDEDQFASLQEEMSTMYESVMNDPRIAEATEKWSACMADAGYPGLAGIDDAQTQFNDMMNAIYEEVYAGLGEDATEDQWMAASEEAEARMAELSEEEIATATADYTCRADVGYDRVTAEVNAEYQQEFYDAHEAELIAWRDAYLASQK